MSLDTRTKDPDRATFQTVPAATFRVRWFQALARAELALGHRIIVDGIDYLMTDRRESDASALRTAVEGDIRQRRRWLVLTCDP